MRSLLSHLLILTFLLTACAGTGSRSRFLSGGKQSTVEEAYTDAERLLAKKYYEQAIEQFEKLRNTFPFSSRAVTAELKISDALYAKGDFAEAADAYRTFARLHPKHEKVDYASFRVGLALYRDAPKSVDRDQTSTESALREFRQFLGRFPESEHAEPAAEYVAKGRNRLAAKELYVGQFYFKVTSFKASIPRFEAVVKRYPETPSAETALFSFREGPVPGRSTDRVRQDPPGFYRALPRV